MPDNFLNTPARSRKPRTEGITSLIDNGVPTQYFIDVINSTPDLIDVVKFGWCTAIVTPQLEKKIQCLLDHHIEFYFGGTLFEKALAQNKLDAFYRFVKKYDCKIVEVSNGTLDIPMDEKAKHIADFAKEFHVLSEVGKKSIEEADNMSVAQWVREILSDLFAGAEKVILESRESGMSGICDAGGNLRPGLIEGISGSRFRITDSIWEAPTKKLQTTLIATFGPNVNLGNIAFGDVIALETLRLGVRSDTFHLYDDSGENYALAKTGRVKFQHPDLRKTQGFLVQRRASRETRDAMARRHAMSQPQIRIIRGTDAPYPAADVNIVIDVIRAFTVAQIAFMRGARDIFLVNTTDEAFAMRQANPGYLLAGEIGGLPIDGFDLDNSPQRVSTANLAGKTLVQKTSNGVKATLLALNAETTLVTGLANARNTALHARQLTADKLRGTINIIASHAEDDDDLACAEYLRDIILGERKLSVEDIKRRIRESRPAQKFYDPNIPAALDARDIEHCARELACDFVMQVDKNTRPPRIVTRRLA